MYYEINVTKDNQHYFATAPRSLQSQRAALQLAGEFAAMLPKGCQIDVRCIEDNVNFIKRLET